jgi:hypothetical protein
MGGQPGSAGHGVNRMRRLGEEREEPTVAPSGRLECTYGSAPVGRRGRRLESQVNALAIGSVSRFGRHMRHKVSYTGFRNFGLFCRPRIIGMT